MRLGILGAGLSGLSLAYFLQDSPGVTHVELVEKEDRPGGLCRSFAFESIHYDVGPHIMFSKDSDVLSTMVRLLGDNVHKLRRSNRIYHDGRFVKYPFENELSALSDDDRQYCVDTFLNNPYAEYRPQNMLQFFLATFGEGLTNLYLRPYNEKIWKFDPSMMDTEMVERIPKPPPEDIINSAKGVSTEGYLHQLWFHYPRTGGIESLVRGFFDHLGAKVASRTGTDVARVEKVDGRWKVAGSDGTVLEYDRLISTIPVPNLVKALVPTPPTPVVHAASRLKWNSILLCVLRVSRDTLGENFAVMVADKSVLCHRLSRLNFLLPRGAEEEAVYLMAEVTYRKGDPVDTAADGDVKDRIVSDLCRLGFILDRGDVLASEVVRFPFAYVIYDLDHRQNMDAIRRYCEGELGLMLHGRFGEFEYWNMDAVVRRSMEQSRRFAGDIAATGVG